MQKLDRSLHLRARTYLRAEDCDVADLATLCEAATDLADYPLVARVEKGVLIYDCPALLPRLADPAFTETLMAEWADAFQNGPGVLVLQGAEPDTAMIDRASDIFRDLIAQQNAAGTGGGDHFAKPGANDRLWNSLEKHCLADPANFARYYANPFLALVSQAWLGPYYQMTAQLNVVNPGGAAQSPHRDYHLGFQSAQAVARYPAHIHAFSPMLTLQGAIAHVDASIEAGPTLLLPHSQKYPAGYLATANPAFRTYFDSHAVQLPLKKGDMLFFSPALFHAAGTNQTKDVKRMVNLFQVSSAYGRAMESINRTAMCKALYPALLSANLTETQTANAIAATAEGYSFPTNLDRDPPIGGLAPKSQAALMHEALAARWSPEAFNAALDAQAAKRLP
ncbi:MAG: phytanoyl-CoA dioxygenase [Rhodobacteraceae bacterium]|nr:phytanoyl-CoA dioxygenase [Paracoccaceae bacterium]